ncbi:hypothetical protein EPH_0026470 [Eimeria praecox]|uniref:Dense granule protein GRA11 n=1 Tax=Eimeria praecox TaxID=51316 RepID=U6H6J6_9EIME|nr:hypothetical protein EPH_0026470 [Eimeria praecox]
MRLHSSLLLVLPGISLAAEVGSQSYETLESSTTYQDAQESTAAVTESMDAEGFGLPHTEEGYAEHVNAEGDESDRPDWRKKLRNRGQCDTTTSNTFTVSGSSEEQLGETEKVAEGEEYESQGYGHGDGKAAHYTGTEIFGFPPPAVPHDPTRRRIYPIPPTPQNPQSGMRRYLATEDADAEAYEEEQTTEPAASRELGKKKKVTYVAEPVKMAPAPIMMAAPTKKAPPMIIEAAPVKKGRYLAAEDETEVQFETEQFETETEQYDSAAERGLGKKKKVTYVSQPMKVAPPPQKYVAPTKAPAPIVMAAPTKKAAPVIIEAAPTKKGRYLAAEDETEMHFETEHQSRWRLLLL